MPRLQELVHVLLDEIIDLVQLARIEPIIGRQSHGLQPELGFITARFDVDVRRLAPLVTEKEESIRPHTQDSGYPAEPREEGSRPSIARTFSGYRRELSRESFPEFGEIGWVAR